MNLQLRIVGAHMGSVETDVDHIALRFNEPPDFALNTTTRIIYLIQESDENAHAFLSKYQDRYSPAGAEV